MDVAYLIIYIKTSAFSEERHYIRAREGVTPEITKSLNNMLKTVMLDGRIRCYGN